MYPVAAARNRNFGTAAVWSPLNLASLTAWWDFSDATTLFTDAGTTPVASDNDLIYQVNDKGPNDLHVAQATEGARGTYKVNIQNGKSVGRLDGGDQWTKDSVTGSTLVGTNTGSIIAVMKQTGADAQNSILGWGAGNGTNSFGILATYDDVFYLDFGQYNAGGRLTENQPVGWDDTWHIIAFCRNGTACQFYVDGGSDLVAETFSDELDNTQSYTLYLGSDYTGTIKLTGDLGDVLVCNVGLSVTDLNLLGTYLATKWALTWTPVS